MKSYRETFAFAMFLLTLALSWSTIAGHALKMKEAKASLPSPFAYSSAVYDEEDSIYIFGG
jgi:hypothetical protein